MTHDQPPPKTLTVERDGPALVVRRRLARRMGVLYLVLAAYVLFLLPLAAQDIVPTLDRVLLMAALASVAIAYIVLRGLHNLVNVAVYRVEGPTLTITQQPLRFTYETYDLSRVSQLEVATHLSGFRDPTTYYGVLDRTSDGRQRWLIRRLKRDEAHFLRDLLARHLSRL